MTTDQKKDYINELLTNKGEGLEGADRDVFDRLCKAKAEGDAAIDGAVRLRNEAINLDGVATNRQGRFDALADLLWESRVAETKAPEEKEAEPEAVEDTEVEAITE